MESPAAFLSYVHEDNEYLGGHILAFADQLRGAVQFVTGRPFRIFVDRNDISWGSNWRARIETALAQVTFFIPIVTPSYFRSEECRKELVAFLQREQELGRTDLILPVYYMTCREMDPSRKVVDALARVISAHQYADWRQLRRQPLTAPEATAAIEQLAAMIQASLEPGPVQRPYYQRGYRPEGPGETSHTILREAHPEGVSEALVAGRVKDARLMFVELQAKDPDAAEELAAKLGGPCRRPPEALVPAGTFSLGLSDEQARRITESVARGSYNIDLSTPAARDEFARTLTGSGRHQADYPSFWIDRYLVSNDQFARFVVLTGYQTVAERQRRTSWLTEITSPDLLRHPVVHISGDDADAYAAWAGRRLPTVEEWDRAAHGPEGLAYPWGDEYVPANCNGEDNLPGWTTCPIDQFESVPSPYGVVDLVGNVDELTASTRDSYRLAAGGSWKMACEVYGLSGIYRLCIPSLPSEALGFRTARDGDQ